MLSFKLARRTAGIGPLTYSSCDVDDGEVAGRLSDTTGHIVARDRRRYVRAVSPRSTSLLQGWAVVVDDNALPDAWLLGVLLACVNLSRIPITRRKRL